jgi:hypothetical protein
MLKGIFKDREFSSSEQIQEAITRVRTISVLRTCAASSNIGWPAFPASLRLEDSIFINKTEWNSKSCDIMEIERGRGLFLPPVLDKSDLLTMSGDGRYDCLNDSMMKAKLITGRRLATYLRIPAEQFYYEVQLYCALSLSDCKETAMNIIPSSNLLKLSVDQGDAIAQCIYGVCLVNGKGVWMDKALAAHYYKLSADQGLLIERIDLHRCVCSEGYSLAPRTCADTHKLIQNWRWLLRDEHLRD